MKSINQALSAEQVDEILKDLQNEIDFAKNRAIRNGDLSAQGQASGLYCALSIITQKLAENNTEQSK